MEAVKQGVDQKLVEGQEKLHQMWLSWNQKQLQGVEGDPGKPEVAVARGGARGGVPGSWLPPAPLCSMDRPTCRARFPRPRFPFTAFEVR